MNWIYPKADSTPDRKRYLIIVNEGFADGSAFDEAWMLKRFETMYSRYAIGRYYQRSQASIQQAGHDKQPLRPLVYGGGALVAMAIEAEMRDATQGKKGVPDLMRSLYSEFGRRAVAEVSGQAAKGYTSADILRHIKQQSGVDMTAFFQRYVSGSEFLDITPYLARLGLTPSHFIEEADSAAAQTYPQMPTPAPAGIFSRPVAARRVNR